MSTSDNQATEQLAEDVIADIRAGGARYKAGDITNWNTAFGWGNRGRRMRLRM